MNQSGLILAVGIGLYMILISLILLIVLNFIFFPIVSLIELPYPGINEQFELNIHTALVVLASASIVGLSAEAIWRHFRVNAILKRNLQKSLFVAIALAISIFFKYWL